MDDDQCKWCDQAISDLACGSCGNCNNGDRDMLSRLLLRERKTNYGLMHKLFSLGSNASLPDDA